MMSGFYYSHTTYPVYGSQSNSILDRATLDLIQAGFDKLPTPTGYGNYLVKCNNAETGLAASNVSVSDAGIMTIPAGLIVTAGTVDLTGTTPLVPTASAGTSSTQAASTAFVVATSFLSSLPGQLGNAGKAVITDGSNASWGTLAALGGGTGQSSYTIGDILYASGATALSKRAAVATGQVLLSQGVGVAPVYSVIGTASQAIRTNAAGTALEGYTIVADVGATIYLASTQGGF